MEYDAILIGGSPFDNMGKVLGPFRLRTAFEGAGYSLKIIDICWALNQDQLFNLLSRLITDKTKILGISAAWFDYASSHAWLGHCHSIKDYQTENFFFTKFRKQFPNITIVAGGTKANAFTLLYDNCDWFLTGFSDIAFVKLADYIIKKIDNIIFTIADDSISKIKIVSADKHYPVTEMDKIETVLKKDDGFFEYQPVPLEVSRGCIFKCAFCTHPFLGKKTYDYIRSAESLASELRRNYELFGTYRYLITDDTFNDSYEKLDIVKRAIEIAKLSRFEFVCYIRPELIITKPKMLSMLIDLGLKGGHIGLESMRKESRLVVGKGIDVNRVLDITHSLNESGAKMHASLIAGLPGDNEDEIYRWNEYLIEHKNHLFRSWNFNALGLQYKTETDIDVPYSLFEKSPEKYGYSIIKIENNTQFVNWNHATGMTSKKASEISDICNEEANKHRKFAGWQLGAAWYNNLSEDTIENKRVQEVSFFTQFMTRAKLRAMKDYNDIMGPVIQSCDELQGTVYR